MADQGFTAFEDNGMMGRTPELQQQMGDLMAKLGIAMGVFVIQTGGNGSAELHQRQAGGRRELRQGVHGGGRRRQALSTPSG